MGSGAEWIGRVGLKWQDGWESEGCRYVGKGSVGVNKGWDGGLPPPHQ